MVLEDILKWDWCCYILLLYYLLVLAELFARLNWWKGNAISFAFLTYSSVNLACVPYYVLLFFMAILFFIISLILGDVCYIVFDFSPSPLGPLLNNSKITSQLENTTSSIGDIFHSCTTGSNLLDVVSQFGINTTDFNFTAVANNQINSFNLSTISSVNMRCDTFIQLTLL